MRLTEKQEGILFDKCMNIWEDISKSPSVRGFAFQIIITTVKKYPELISEIEFLTQNHYLETISPGIRHSIKRMIRDVFGE
jgi:urate oxidase